MGITNHPSEYPPPSLTQTDQNTPPTNSQQKQIQKVSNGRAAASIVERELGKSASLDSYVSSVHKTADQRGNHGHLGSGQPPSFFFPLECFFIGIHQRFLHRFVYTFLTDLFNITHIRSF